MEVAALLWGILLPGFIVGIGMLVSTKASTTEGGLSWASLLLGLAFAAGFLALFGLPPVPSSSRTLAATDWLVWMIAVGGLVMFASGKLRGMAIPLRLLYGGATLALVLRATFEYQWNGAEVYAWPAGLALLGLLAFASLRGLVRRSRGASMPAVLLVVLTGLALCSALTGSAKIGQLVGLLCAGVGALWIVSWMRPSLRLSSNELTLIVTTALGFGLCAHFYSELPGLEASLLACGAFTPWLAHTPPFAARSERARGLWRVVFALLVVGAAVGRAVYAFETAPADEYDYGY